MAVTDAFTDPTTLDRAYDQVISESDWDALVSNSLFNYKRQVVELTNRSGGAVVAGDVVVLDTANDSAFTTTATEGSASVLGVAQESIASLATGKVQVLGIASVNTNAATARGNRLATSTTAKQARPSAAASSGDFAVALVATGAAGLVTALLLGPVGAGAGGGDFLVVQVFS